MSKIMNMLFIIIQSLSNIKNRVGYSLRTTYLKIRYGSMDKVPDNELGKALTFSSETEQFLQFIFRHKEVCEKIQIEESSTYIWDLMCMQVQGNFPDVKFTEELWSMITAESTRLAIYRKLIEKGDVREDKAKYLTTEEQYQEFQKWLGEK